MAQREWMQFHTYILDLEQEGVVTRTFRRLDPGRQQAILTAILEEAIEKGPSDLNIKQVARRAGVSVGSLYTYFPDREGLLAFAVEICARSIVDLLEQGRPYLAGMPLREALAAYVLTGVEWGQTEANLVRFFARAAYHGGSELTEQLVRPVADALRQTVHEMLQRAAQRGEIREDVDLEAAARIVHALTIAVGDSQLLPYLNAYFQVSDGDMPAERAVDALLAMVITGIGPN